MTGDGEYRCISCLRLTPQVFKEKPPTSLKCEICSGKSKSNEKGILADHYFECPPLIILLDLLLLREKAFCHVLFNQKLGRKPIQLGVLALIADSFHSWVQSQYWSPSIFDEINSISNLYETQKLFYYFLIESTARHSLQEKELTDY